MLGVGLAIGMALAWAIAGIMLQRVPKHLDPFLVSGARAASGMLTTILAILLFGVLDEYGNLTWTQVLYLWASVLAGGVAGDVLYLGSIRLLGMTRGFPIINTYPLFTVLLSVTLLGERVDWQVIVGAFVVLSGIYLVVRPARQSSNAEQHAPARRDLIKGVLLAFGTAAVYGVEAILIAIGVGEVNGIVASGVRLPVVAIIGLTVAAGKGALVPEPRVDRLGVTMLIVSGAVTWTLAGSLWMASVQQIGPSKAAIIGSTAPLFAVPLSAIFLQEKPTWWTLAGTILTVGGIILVM